jgi:hypothetical protein
MKTCFRILVITVLGCLLLTAAPGPDLAGNWKGTVDTGTVKLRLLFKISGEAGKFTAKMDSLDQGVRDIPVDSVAVQNDTLRMVVGMIQGVYDGKLDKSGSKATGQWLQSGITLPMTLEKVANPSALLEPEVVPAKDLAASKAAATKLAGTWTGSLHYGTASLRLRVNITNTPAGAATGTMDSLDQGASAIPLSGITLTQAKARFEARGLGGSYEGTLSPEGAAMKGEWQQAGQTLPLELKKAPKL